MDVIEELKFRGLFDKATHPETEKLIREGKAVFYVGFDPTADSFHVGQLAVFNLMRILVRAKNQPIALLGGGTGMIGDPSGKSTERNLLDAESLKKNKAGCQKQLHRYLSLENASPTLFLDNYDWLSRLGCIEFLRDIGKFFSVNQMIRRDSVAKRINDEKQGISYTEFTYMIFQAYDFYYLCKEHGCNLQLGGSDQWGNIVSGIDLIRRLLNKEAYGLTMPLVQKSDGSKFGKSEAGTIWLDADKTSPYEFYQYFLRIEDSEVIKLLKCMTSVSRDSIEEMAVEIEKNPEKRIAQKLLAESITFDVHGKEGLSAAQRASSVLFGGSPEGMKKEEIEAIFKDVPSSDFALSELEEGLPILDLLVRIKACPSKSEARKMIQAGGIYLNNRPIGEIDAKIDKEHRITSEHIILRRGKKNYFLLRFSE